MGYNFDSYIVDIQDGILKVTWSKGPPISFIIPATGSNVELS
jgi:hypothetical protein